MLAPSAGVRVGNSFDRYPGQQDTPPADDPLTSLYKLYNKSTEQQMGDYGNIMQGYKDLVAKSQSQPGYQRTGELGSAFANLHDLANTGGYSTADVQNLRERGISPIRSIYAGAERDVNRQAALSGYNPASMGALKAKMAREMSDKMAGAMGNVNAGLAQNIAQNKLSIAPTWANAATSENELSNTMNRQNLNTNLGALQGMTSLYGTNPALVKTFGDQALDTNKLKTSVDQSNKDRLANIGIAGMRLF